MRLFNKARCVCMQNIRKWPTDYRVWIIAILLFILTHMFTKELVIFSEDVQIDISPWIFPFLFTQKFIKLLFFFPLILLFCNAPFIDDNQAYIILRSGRIPWSIGQVGYIIFATAIYFLFLVFLTIAINIFNLQFTSEWGKVLGTLANTNAANLVGLKINVSSNILHYFSPLQAMWFTFLLNWLVGVLLGLIIYVFNLLSNIRMAGVLIASFLLVLDATVTGRPNLYRFSPVSWSNLDRINIEGITQMPTITYIYLLFAILIVGCILAAVLVNRKQTINFLPPV